MDKGVLLPYRPGFCSRGAQATESNVVALKGRRVVIQLFKIHHFLILDGNDTVTYNLTLFFKIPLYI